MSEVILGNLMHNIMHVIIALLAIFLFVISIIAFKRNRKTKFLFISGAFLIFAIKEIILAINIMTLGIDPLIILTHAFNLVILILFALGILR